MEEKIKYINSPEWEKEVINGGKVIVDFYSTECPPCEALAAKYEALSEVFGDDVKFIKIFRQQNRELAVSLGVTSSPTILFFDNGKMLDYRLSGGIRRKEILAGLELLITKERVDELKKKFPKVETETDVLILGGGPAGLAAAIYTAQAKLNTIVVDKDLPGGQVKITHQVSNYPGFIEPIPGYELMHNMAEQAKKYGTIFRSAVDITSIDLINKKVVIDEVETITAKKIILASGSSPKLLEIKGEKEYKGQGISYCATCDAKFYQDKHVVVIGGGNSAIEEALFITKFASKVTIVHQFDKLQANKLAQEKAFANPKIEFMFEHEPREFIKGDKTVDTVVVEDLKTGELKKIKCDGVFIFIGMQPNLEDLADVLELDEWGYVKVDERMRTNIPDVYAVGDVAHKIYRQITIAVGDGTIAAIDISNSLS